MARVLLVDDDLNLLDTARDILEAAGYEIAVAKDIAGALRALAGPACQIMIADLNLPDGTGIDLAGRARDLFPSMRIILMTGQAEGAAPAGLAARQNGIVDDYLVKPVSPNQLLQVLKRLLS